MDQTATLEAQKEAKTTARPSVEDLRLDIARPRARPTVSPRAARTALLWVIALFLASALLVSLSAGSARFDGFRVVALVLSVVLPIALIALARPRK